MKLSEHFDDSEFACRCGCGFGAHPGDVSPALLAGLEELRAQLGRPIRIRSGCRCPAHNVKMGGAAHSGHKNGSAADIGVEGMTARGLYDAAAGIAAFGGFGLADWEVGGFVHVDVRPKLSAGEATRWRYWAGGRRVPWDRA